MVLSDTKVDPGGKLRRHCFTTNLKESDLRTCDSFSVMEGVEAHIYHSFQNALINLMDEEWRQSKALGTLSTLDTFWEICVQYEFGKMIDE